MTYTAPSFTTDAPEVTLLEARSLLASSGTTGLRTWEAALLLGTYLFSSTGRYNVQNKNIIELGAGTGFLSVLCAKHLGAKYVLATDGCGEVVNDLESNFFLNGLDGTEVISAAVLSWGHMLTDDMLKGADGNRSYDLVVGADVVGTDLSDIFTFLVLLECISIFSWFPDTAPFLLQIKPWFDPTRGAWLSTLIGILDL